MDDGGSMRERIINTIRLLSAEAIQEANSGHPGLPLGAAPMAYTLWAYHMRHNPANPQWINRDRFILSAGHGSMLQYSLLHLFGYDMSIDEIKRFRQFGSKTPGHPEAGHTEGVEFSTGPLGQGLAAAVGFALAERHLAETFNRPNYEVMDHYTYALVGDGCLMEGISYEAASLAGTLGLHKLVVLYDSNNISIEGNTSLAFTEDVVARFKAMNWHVIELEDGNNTYDISTALRHAHDEQKKPTIIVCKTVIGYGCKSLQGSEKTHGSPLGEAGIEELRTFAGMTDRKAFEVPEDVRNAMQDTIEALTYYEKEWNKIYDKYKKYYPEQAKQLMQWFEHEETGFVYTDDFFNVRENIASRVSSSNALNRVAEYMPSLIGGSADLGPSNKSVMTNRTYISADDFSGANIHFGVREHAMAAISNGLMAHGGLRPYCSTFLIFSDYMKPAMRLASLIGLPVIYILTHDSIGVGEDGPTHQPIEQLAMLRSMPNMTVIRPADSVEVSAAWAHALSSKTTPTALILSRQNLPVLDHSSKDAMNGAYVVHEKMLKTKIDVILIGTGSEVALCIEAAKHLEESGMNVRVVSMPSMEIFEQQPESYKNQLLPNDVPCVSVEAASTFGWAKYADLTIGMEQFGISAPSTELFKHFGLDAVSIAKKVSDFLKK